MQDGARWGAWAQPVFGAYLGLEMTHFLVAGVWHLRDATQRALMRGRFRFLD